MSLLPPLSELPGRPKRVIFHWSAGGNEASAHDRERYHLLIEAWQDKWRLQGGVPVGRNMQSVGGLPGFHNDAETGYASHTAGMNSWSLGVSLCGMRGAVDRRPDGEVDPGDSPITAPQVDGLVRVCAQIGLDYGLEPEPRQMLGHCEVPRVFEVPQPGKWDISWLPGRPELDSGEKVGDWLRSAIHQRMQEAA